MMNTLLRTTVITTLLLISHASSAEIYKWKDDNGKIHYSQTPPAATEVENISNKIRMASGSGQSTPTTHQAKTTTPEVNISDASQKNTNKTSTPPQNFCQQQQDILQQLLSNPVVKWSDGKSEKLLNAKQRQAKIKEYESSVATACDALASENMETPKKPDTTQQ